MDSPYKYTPVAVPIYGNDNINGLEVDEAVSALEERFFTAADTPSLDARPYLEVVAPATLPEGYTFEAEANGHTFNVTVPMGGVEEGQRFSVPFISPGSSSGFAGAAIPRASVPVGQWKDGRYACFRLGVTHPVLWNACCCPLVLAGQIMHRLKLTWLGKEGSIAETASTFRILLSITAVYFLVDQLLKFSPLVFIDENGTPTTTAVVLIEWRYFLGLVLSVFTVIIVTRTRKRIRSRYSIPTKRCGECEDFCCSFWCMCCTLSQMARHTADYETYAARCCSETGLSPNAPSIV